MEDTESTLIIYLGFKESKTHENLWVALLFRHPIGQTSHVSEIQLIRHHISQTPQLSDTSLGQHPNNLTHSVIENLLHTKKQKRQPASKLVHVYKKNTIIMIIL